MSSDSIIRSRVWTLGNSVLGCSLDAYAIAPMGAKSPLPSSPGKAEWPWVFLLGGVHGNEIEGVWLLERMLELWSKDFPYKKSGVVLWPRVNPDGVAKGERCNARQVDLNRNLPTKDWSPEVKNPRYPPGPFAASEPENQALVRLIENCAPQAILSAHSFSQMQVNSNGPAEAWSEALAKICAYPVTKDIGYPTPGCLGTYSGVELGIPTITLEIERGLPQEKVLDLHVPVLKEALYFWESEY